MKGLITTILIFSFMIELHSQNLKNNYLSFSKYSTPHIVEFVNDSLVRVSNIRSHMGKYYSFVNSYKVKNDTVIIFFNSRILNTDELKRVSLNYLFDKEIKLIKNGDEYIDLTNRIVYVNLKKYYRKKYSNKIIIEFNGKKIIRKTPKKNGYGIITKQMERRSKIKSKYLKKILMNPENYSSTRLDFMDGYNKYGVLGLKGVLIYNKIK